MTSRRTHISRKSGRGLGHVTPTIFGSTVGYPSDSLASCIFEENKMCCKTLFYDTTGPEFFGPVFQHTQIKLILLPIIKPSSPWSDNPLHVCHRVSCMRHHIILFWPLYCRHSVLSSVGRGFVLLAHDRELNLLNDASAPATIQTPRSAKCVVIGNRVLPAAAAAFNLLALWINYSFDYNYKLISAGHYCRYCTLNAHQHSNS